MHVRIQGAGVSQVVLVRHRVDQVIAADAEGKITLFTRIARLIDPFQQADYFFRCIPFICAWLTPQVRGTNVGLHRKGGGRMTNSDLCSTHLSGSRPGEVAET